MTASDLLLLDGYEVVEADDFTSIFQDIIEQQPDLILLDTMMRQLDSFDLCRQLKENYRTDKYSDCLYHSDEQSRRTHQSHGSRG